MARSEQSDNRVYCSDGKICDKKNWVPKERAPDGNYVCLQCQNPVYGEPLLVAIKRCVKFTKKAPLDQFRFAIRELAQNADDANARIIVIRIDEDALYVANNGRVFEPPSETTEGDFIRICGVLAGWKSDDPRATGAHGSGFQSVYCFTNHPEIHSGPNSAQMNPMCEEKKRIIEFPPSNEPKKKSPYGPAIGVLFRFPWRDKKEAEREYDGKKIFEKEEDWPRWNKKKIQDMAEDLFPYLHDLILCCKNLEIIRLIWSPDDGRIKGYQARRKGFHLNEVPERNVYVASVEEGYIGVPGDWEKSFSENIDGKGGMSNETSYRYLVGYGVVKDENGDRIYYGKNEDEETIVTSDLDEIADKPGGILDKHLILRSDIHILLPLFDSSKRSVAWKPNYFRYSDLPIPYVSKNGFVCTAHLKVDEDRSSLTLADSFNKDWLKYVNVSLKRLYLELLCEYLPAIKKTNDSYSEEEKQNIVLNVVPGDHLYRWINPISSEMEEEELTDEYVDLIKEVVGLPILNSDAEWSTPLDAYFVEDSRIRDILCRMGEKIIPDGFRDHQRFPILKTALSESLFHDESFPDIWKSFSKRNGEKLTLHQKLSNGGKLDDDFLISLITYCLSSNQPFLMSLPIIPDSKGHLHGLEDFPIIPAKYESLEKLLAPEQQIHKDLVRLVGKLNERKASTEDVIKTLSKAIDLQSDRLTDLKGVDLAIIIEAVVKAIKSSDFSIDAVKNCKFIPFEFQGKIRIGEPNKGGDGEVLPAGFHTGDDYEKYHIFKTQKVEVPGLTPEIKRGIRFLYLKGVDDDDIKVVETKLRLVALQEKSKGPTNFARVYISPSRAGGTLFDDSVLRKFLKETALIDKDMTSIFLHKQKLSLLETVKAYFLKEDTKGETGLQAGDMKSVPCFFDQKEHWHPASEFAIDVDEDLEILGKHSLNLIFFDEDEWPRKILISRFGVCETAKVSDVANKIIDLIEEGVEKNRTKLKKISTIILSSTMPLADEENGRFIDLPKIKDRKWVPTVGGNFKNLDEVMLPTKENIIILGPGFEGFIELPEKHPIDIESERTKEWARSLGISTSPSTKDLLSAIEVLKKKKDKPIPRIFEILSSEEKTTGFPTEQYQERTGNIGYFANDCWWDRDQIKIIDQCDTPPELEGGLLLIQKGMNPHERYISYYLKVDYGIDDDNLLDIMSSGNIKITMDSWALLSKSNHPEAIDIKSRYGGKRLFPNPLDPKDLLMPDKIIFSGNVLKRQEKIGDFFILDQEGVPEEIVDKLEELGARYDYSLDQNILLSMMDSISWEGLDDDHELECNQMMRLLSSLADLWVEKEATIDSRRVLVPIRNSENKIECEHLSDCYSPSHHLAAKFKGKIPIPEEIVDNEYHKSLRALYDNFCKGSYDAIESKVNIYPKDSEGAQEKEQETRFKELANALKAYVENDQKLDDQELKELIASFSWLRHCKVIRFPDITVEYKLGDIKLPDIRGFNIDQDNGAYVIKIAQYAPESIKNELPIEIVNIMETNRPSQALKERSTDFCNLMSYLLFTDNLHFWENRIKSYLSGTDSKILAPLVDILDTTEGYLETKGEFMRQYGVCQICKERTPSDEKGIESCETITSVMSMRGGRYKGEFTRYEAGNCLFLCPTHQTLYKRGLIKLPYLEEAKLGKYDQAKTLIMGKRSEAGKRGGKGSDLEIMQLGIEIFQTPINQDNLKQEGEWAWSGDQLFIIFRKKHLLQYLEMVEKYIEGQRK